MPGTRKLGRATASRTAMLTAMVTFLLENGKIETTVTRAKEVKAMTEKIITKAKQNDLHSKRQVILTLQKKLLLRKSLMILLQNMQRETAVTAVSSRSVLAAVTQQRWQSSN